MKYLNIYVDRIVRNPVNSKFQLKYFTQPYKLQTPNGKRSIHTLVVLFPYAVCGIGISRILHKSLWQHVFEKLISFNNLNAWMHNTPNSHFPICKSISLKYLCYGIISGIGKRRILSILQNLPLTNIGTLYWIAHCVVGCSLLLLLCPE